MATEKSTSKVEKFYLWLKVLLLVVSALFALLNELALLTFLIVALFILIFLLNSFYTWKVKVGESNAENYDTFARILSASRSVFITASLIIPLLCVAIDEMHTYFPKWQQSFIIEHFTKDDEIKELKPTLIPVDSVAIRYNPTQKEIPSLCIQKENSFYYFNHSQITGEMLRYADKSFDTVALALAGLLLVFTLVLILIDFLGSIRPKLAS